MKLDNDFGDVNNDSSSKKITIQVTKLHVMNWRERICEWSYQVADHFDLPRDIVYVTLNYLDRVCSVSSGVELLRDKGRFQLLAMTTLCIAIKVHGEMDTSVPRAESLIVDTILRLGRDQFKVQELEAMEIDALQQLEWLLHPPTPQMFVSYFIELFCTEAKSELNDVALYLVELSVHDYFFIASKPSVTALAALSNAALLLGQSRLWANNIRCYLLDHFGYEERVRIDACGDRLHKLYRNTGTNLGDFDGNCLPVAIYCNDEFNEIVRDFSPTSTLD